MTVPEAFRLPPPPVCTVEAWIRDTHYTRPRAKRYTARLLLVICDGVYIGTTAPFRSTFVPWCDVITTSIPLPADPIGHPAS